MGRTIGGFFVLSYVRIMDYFRLVKLPGLSRIAATTLQQLTADIIKGWYIIILSAT